MATDIASLGTILGVWAHPDDETYLMGGIMAAASSAGQRVVCVTATRGEAGSQDEARWPPAELGGIREHELMNALQILGVREHHWLGYADGACVEADHEEAIRKVTAIIEDVEPDSILTFGPDGMTDHPDHKEVSAWTTEAFWRAAKSGATLYYATTTPEWNERFGAQLEPLNVFGPDGPSITERGDLGIDFEAGGDPLERKFRALRAQTSQTEGMIAAVGEDMFRTVTASETFRTAGTH